MKNLVAILMLVLSVNSFSQNPGNLGTVNLTAWFKPDALALGNLTNWTTTFPVGVGSISVTDNTAPYPFVTNVPAGNSSNYNSTIEFAANSNTTIKALQNTGSLNLLNNSTSTSQGTFFAVYYFPTFVRNNNHMMLYNEAGSDAIQFRNLGAVGRFATGKGLGTSTNASRDWTENNIPTIISYKGNRSGVGTLTTNENSKVFTGGGASQSSGSTGLYFGIMPGNTNSPFNGFLNEFIFYNRDLTASEMSKVHAYLGVKYGVTLDNTGGGIQGDYTATDGTIIWDASVNPTYHNDVIGIGRDDSQALLQRQSHSFDDVTRVYLNTLQPTNIANTGVFNSDTSYVMMGSNGGLMCSRFTTVLEVPPTPLLNSRLEREWKVTKSNFSQNLNCDFTISPCATGNDFDTSCLALLVDDDGDFTNATVYNSTSGLGFSISGNVITVSGISNLHIPDDSTRYITLASVFFTKELSNDTIKCEGDSVLLDAGNTGATYLWSNGKTTQTIYATTQGTYSVILSSNGCFEYDTVVVTDQVTGASFFTIDTSGCVPVTINFTDLSTVNFGMIVQWGWKFGDGSFSTIQNPVKTYAIPGSYSVELEVTSSLGCKDDTVIIGFIDVYPFAIADFYFTPAFTNTRELVIFSNFSINTSSFKWYFGDGDSSVLASPTHEYLEEGLYEITLIAMNPFGCNDTIIKTIEIKNELYFVANSFTPYPEGKNPEWGFVGLKQLDEFELQVFDRWGEVVFETTDPSNTWDGKYENELCPQGVYTWRVKMKFKSRKIVEKIGHVNLLR
ncbi:MAG: PKD domain-containing protein [Flavobacteriales bacterium]|tara:strand:- start:5571 stop:7928 length:2358 start_codon:yes stop_codon:yes gene_type:complete